jgi:hypothetical protein
MKSTLLLLIRERLTISEKLAEFIRDFPLVAVEDKAVVAHKL